MAIEDLKQMIAQADNLTKQGKRTLVLPLLESIRNAKPPRELLPSIARIANRNAAYILGLRILYPEIQNERENIRKASAESLAVYANSLLNIGALEEARQLTDQVLHLPEAKLIRAFIDFAKWDYDKALPTLQSYIRTPHLPPYQVLVGQVNRAAALIVTGGFLESRSILLDLIQKLKVEKSGQLLLGNCFELLSQIDLAEGNYDLAQVNLTQATEILSAFEGRYMLYVRKWLGVIDLIGNKQNTKSLQAVRADALSLRNWETVRDCDLHTARLTGNSKLLQKIYLGTPYKGFRVRLQNFYQIHFESDSSIQFCPGALSEEPTRLVLNLEQAASLAKASVTTAALMQTMTQDIYRPPRMGVVFSSLYPTEKFNPFTSIQRIRNSLIRFNRWAQENKSGLKIEVYKGDFLLRTQNAGDGIQLRVRQRSTPLWRLRLKYFRECYGAKSFKTQDLVRELQLSERAMNDLVKTGLEHGVLEKRGRGRETHYLFSSHRKLKPEF